MLTCCLSPSCARSLQVLLSRVLDVKGNVPHISDVGDPILEF